MNDEIVQAVRVKIEARNTPAAAEAHEACSNSIQRLHQTEGQLQRDLAVIERNFHPIRLLSTQSNQKNLICPKQNSYLGWMPHLDSYQLIQNTKTPPHEEILDTYRLSQKLR